MSWYLVKHRDNFTFGIDELSLIPSRGINGIFLPLCPNQLWDLSNLLSNGYQRFYPGGKTAGA